VAFGLGAGLPLIALSIVSAAQGQAVARAIAARRGAIERVAGVLLVVAGVSDLVVSWPALLAAFASGALRSG
jgi:cytochrome c biogenesis protein CcdA